MNTSYIVTQAWSIRHIITRGFGPFISVDYGKGELVELGDAHVARSPAMQANLSTKKDMLAQVLTQPTVEVER